MRRFISFLLFFLIFLPSFGEADIVGPCESACYFHYNECYKSKQPPSVYYYLTLPAETNDTGQWDGSVEIYECGNFEPSTPDHECRLTNLTQEDLIIPACEDPQKECLRDCQELRQHPCMKGCYSLSTKRCLPYSVRVIEERNLKNVPMYCSTEGILERQKEHGEAAQNDYECQSNSARYGVCEDIAEQTNILQKIFRWLGVLFGGS